MPVCPRKLFKKRIVLSVAFFAGVLVMGLFSQSLGLLSGTEAALDFQTQTTTTSAEVIDLALWRDRKGRTLAEASAGHSVVMVVLVNPNCATCASLKDSLKALRARTEKSGMGYYVLMIPDGSDTDKYFAYADSLNLGAEAFVWSNTEAKPPASLATMSVPSHVLLSNEGKVEGRYEARILNVWAGVPENTSTP